MDKSNRMLVSVDVSVEILDVPSHVTHLLCQFPVKVLGHLPGRFRPAQTLFQFRVGFLHHLDIPLQVGDLHFLYRYDLVLVAVDCVGQIYDVFDTRECSNYDRNNHRYHHYVFLEEFC